MLTLHYDNKSGKLVRDRIWQFCVTPLQEGYCWAEVMDSQHKEIVDCKINKAHKRYEFTHVQLEILGGGPKALLGDFVPVDRGFDVISEKFWKRLKESGLTGFSIKDVVTARDQAGKDYRLFLLESTGRPHRVYNSKRWRITNGENVCPQCEAEPIICPSCGEWTRTCTKTQKQVIATADAAEYKRRRGKKMVLLKGDFPPAPYVVEGKEWDGSDFFGSFISDKAKLWLERTHTFPTDIRPALLDIEGVEDRFKK